MTYDPLHPSSNCADQGGEDLRLDQRIEQLFEVMNGVLRQSAAGAKRGLRLGTYKVVPMTGSVGMIEWVKNTRPLKVSHALSWFLIAVPVLRVVHGMLQSILETGIALKVNRLEFDLLHDDRSPNQVRNRELMQKYGGSRELCAAVAGLCFNFPGSVCACVERSSQRQVRHRHGDIPERVPGGEAIRSGAAVPALV